MILMNSGLVSNSAVYTLNGGTMCRFRLGRQYNDRLRTSHSLDDKEQR